MDLDIYAPATIVDTEIIIGTASASAIFKISFLKLDGTKIKVCVGIHLPCGIIERTKFGRLTMEKIWFEGGVAIHCFYRTNHYITEKFYEYTLPKTYDNVHEDIKVHAPQALNDKDGELAKVFAYRFVALDLECHNGTYSDGETCKNCTVDHYCPNTGMTNPLACPVDQHQPHEGQLECVEKPIICTIGTFLDNNIDQCEPQSLKSKFW